MLRRSKRLDWFCVMRSKSVSPLRVRVNDNVLIKRTVRKNGESREVKSSPLILSLLNKKLIKNGRSLSLWRNLLNEIAPCSESPQIELYRRCGLYPTQCIQKFFI